MNIVFAGSFLQYSATVLQGLLDDDACDVTLVITTPPTPMGRNKVLTKSAVHQLAEEHGIPVQTPSSLNDLTLQDVIDTVGAVDYLVTAGYGKFLPPSWLSYPTVAAVNLHFSLLPAYRGANPAEWAILHGEQETGVTLITMSEGIDEGDILAQASLELTNTDTRESVYEKLYELGGSVLPAMLHEHVSQRESTLPLGMPQPVDSPTPDARRFIRAHGFMDWQALLAAMHGKPIEARHLSTHLKTAYAFLNLERARPTEQAMLIERAIRALSGFPGVWTYVRTTKGKQRMKVLSASLKRGALQLDMVQLEGKQAQPYSEVKDSIL